MYRFALFTAGFENFKSLSRSEYFTGCYVLHLELYLQICKCLSSVREISVIVSAETIHDVFRAYIEDVLKSAEGLVEG